MLWISLDTGWGPSWHLRPAGTVFRYSSDHLAVLFCRVGVAASLYASGIINGEHVTILMPALILMASQIQYMGRLLGLADVPKKYWPLLMVISIFNAFIGMFIMKLLMPFFN